jgi:hypothetical protein
MLIIKISAPGNVKATRNCGDGGIYRNVHADTQHWRKHSVPSHFMESRSELIRQLKTPRSTINRDATDRFATGNRDLPNGRMVRPAKGPTVNLALTHATLTTLL